VAKLESEGHSSKKKALKDPESQKQARKVTEKKALGKGKGEKAERTWVSKWVKNGIQRGWGGDWRKS